MDQIPLCPGPWPWYVWCLLSMKASFKGKRLSCNGEGKVHCFCMLFLGPKSCCKFCSIKTRPCCLLSVLPPPLAFPASQYYWLRILKQYNTGLYYFEWMPLRWEIFSCVLCLTRLSASSRAVGNFSNSSFLIPDIWQSLWVLHCTHGLSQLLWTPVLFPHWRKCGT